MKVSTETTPEHQAIATVEVEDAEMQKALQRAAQHISRIRPIPGFRPGKAPYNMVERTFGKDILVEEAIEELSRSLYPQVLKEANLEPADQGRLEVVQKEPPILKYTIPLQPEVKLGDYMAIRKAPQPVEVTDEDVNKILERFQLNQSTMVPVTRSVQKGDVVTMDIKGGIPGEEPIDNKDVRVAIGDEEQPQLPFEDQVIGMTAGETKEIAYTYSQEDESESVRGKTANYTVTVTDIKETQLPELNDDFVKTISQFETLDQFKGNIRQVLQRQKEREEEDRYADAVIDELVAQSEIKYPSTMVDREVEHQLEHTQEDVKRLGLTWDKYLELSNKTEDQVREEMRPAAEKNLKRILALNELVKVENPEVTRAEVDADIERRVQQTVASGGNANVARKSYNARDARQNIEFNIRMAKAIGKLVASAKGEATSGLILTPDMVRDEENPIPSGLITDPNQVRAEDWPKGLE